MAVVIITVAKEEVRRNIHSMKVKTVKLRHIDNLIYVHRKATKMAAKCPNR